MRNNMKRMLCLLLAAITLAVLGTISVFAAEPPDGANSSESSSVVNSNEYASLTDAIAAAKEGDTVIVSAGTYDGFMIYRSNVTVVAEGDVNVTGMIFIAGNNVTLDGFTVNNPYGGAALEISGSTTVKDSTLSGDLAVRANSANATVVLENTNVNGRMDLAHLKATIKAVEGLNVTASVGFGIADYIDGVYRVRWHVEEILPSVAPTFTSTGLTEGVKCSVCGEVLVAQEIIAKLIPVAQIGNELYSSLANAIAAAQNGDTIKLIADITLTESDLTILGTNRVAVLVSGKSITLDLNGKNLTVNTEGVADGNVGIAVDADAELVFMDSGNGSFTVVGENAYYAFRNDGKLTIDSGKISFTGYPGGAIFFSTNSNTLIKGGNFTQTTEGWMANTIGNGVHTITFLGGTYNRYFIGGSAYGENLYNEAVVGNGLTLNDNGNGTWTIGGAIVQVGDLLFGTLESALAAAQNGDTVILLGDLTVNATDARIFNESTYGYSTLFLVEGKQITLDFNGHTLTVNPNWSSTLISVFFAGKNASLTFKDSVGSGGLCVNASSSDLYCAFYNSNSTVVFENGNYYVAKVVVSGSLIYADKQNDTTIFDGNFILGNAGADASTKPWIFNIHGKNEGNFIKVNGGTFNQDLLMNYNTKKDCEVEIPSSHKLVNNGDGTWSVVMVPVAQIGDKLYGSLSAAITDAQNGDVIKLIADITLTEADLTILETNRVAVLVSGKSITLDLNGKNLTVNTEGVADGNVGIAVDADAELVFMDSGNGSFTVIGENAYYAFRNDGKLTIESGNVSFTGYSGGAIFFSTNGNTLVKGGNFTQTTEGWMANTSGKGDFVVTFVGGTYNRYFIGGAEYNENIHNEAVLGDGLKLNDNGDGTWTVISAGRELYVGDGYYDTLEEALAVAKNGDKIVLLKDLSITATDANVLYESTYGYSTLFLIEGKQIALDFNGYTVSVTPEFSSTLISVFFVGKGASLSMQDSVGNGGLHVNAGTDLYCAFYNSNSTIVIENGNYYVEKVVVSGSLVYADKQNDTTVENGNFTLGNAGTDSSSKPWIFNIHGKNEGNFIKINGGTYNQDLLMNYDTKRDCEVVLSDDCYLKELAGLYTVTKNDEE